MSRRDLHLSAQRVQARERTGGGRLRAWALALAAMLGMGFKPPYWGQIEELAGTIVLNPGEPASLRIRTAMENDLGVSYWRVGLRISGVSASGDGSTAGGGLVVRVNGQVEGDAASTCELESEDPDSGAPEWNLCTVEATCPDGASSCEAVVEYQLLSTSDTSVTVEWVVRAGVDGSTRGCCQDPDEVEASLELEALD